VPKAGIVGLPNVGKSTLFNALTESFQAESANYPFCTIEPNVGTVTVPDPRLKVLQNLVKTQVVIPSVFEFVDIAGLVKGASKGEGLGNQFLSHIREVDMIVQVVRCFEDENITHVDGSVSPVRDAETILLELCMADFASIEKRAQRLGKQAKSQDKEAVAEMALIEQIRPWIEAGEGVHLNRIAAEDRALLHSLHLLTAKPILFAANLAESDLCAPEKNSHYQAFSQWAKEAGHLVVPISACIESELVGLDSGEERQEFLESLGVQTSGVDNLISKTYTLLGLETYFTAGEKEVRAWAYPKGYTAPKCAGIIHTDFEKGFIRAEVTAYSDFVACGGEKGAKEKGLLRLEGKEYLVQDGDVMHFRFNV
jgi:ribosome-binding ATPase